MITEDYVNFELAKLLKEKGFDEPLNYYYNCDGRKNYATSYNWNQTTGDFQDYSCPTLQMAMKWLRKVHNLHIMVDCIGSENYMPTIQFTRNSKDIEIKSKINKIGGNGFDSNEQAIHAAIKYCLEHLV